MRLLRTQMTALGVTAIAIGAVASPALASPSAVASAIKAQDKTTRAMPSDRYLIKHLDTSDKAVAEKLAPELGPLYRASQHAVAVVAKVPASDARDRQGKLDWIKGSREDDRGLLQYRTALRDLIAGNQTAFKRDQKTANRTLGDGLSLAAKGDKLLGISIND